MYSPTVQRRLRERNERQRCCNTVSHPLNLFSTRLAPYFIPTCTCPLPFRSIPVPSARALHPSHGQKTRPHKDPIRHSSSYRSDTHMCVIMTAAGAPGAARPIWPRAGAAAEPAGPPGGGVLLQEPFLHRHPRGRHRPPHRAAGCSPGAPQLPACHGSSCIHTAGSSQTCITWSSAFSVQSTRGAFGVCLRGNCNVSIRCTQRKSVHAFQYTGTALRSARQVFACCFQHTIHSHVHSAPKMLARCFQHTACCHVAFRI
jgi:hypothetical protein